MSTIYELVDKVVDLYETEVSKLQREIDELRKERDNLYKLLNESKNEISNYQNALYDKYGMGLVDVMLNSSIDIFQTSSSSSDIRESTALCSNELVQVRPTYKQKLLTDMLNISVENTDHINEKNDGSFNDSSDEMVMSELNEHCRDLLPCSISIESRNNNCEPNENIEEDQNKDLLPSSSSMIIQKEEKTKPQYCPEYESFLQYKEKVNQKKKKKKKNRTQMKPYFCACCKNYWENRTAANEMAAACRHRKENIPPQTPQHFWSIGMPSTQECIERGYGGFETDEPLPPRPRRKRKLNLPPPPQPSVNEVLLPVAPPDQHENL